MKIKTLLIVGLALCLTASVALAGTTVSGSGAWQSFVVENIDQDGNPYWDNPSLDTGNRNVGYFLTGTGGVFATNFLGATPQFWGGAFDSTADTGGAADPNFTFSTTLPSTASTFLVRITGFSGSDTIGIYNTVTGTQTQLFGPSDSVGATKTVTLPSSFGLYGLSGDGFTYFSESSKNTNPLTGETIHQHFALFQDPTKLGVFYAGFEDLAGTLGTERIGDYNDLVMQFTPVPLPPSVLLLGSGLLGLVGLRWRRKKS